MALTTYKGALLLGSVLAGSYFVGGQTRNCDLETRVYSYDAYATVNNRIPGVSVHLRNLKGGNQLSLDPEESTFKNLEDGKYELQFEKVGFKTRKKHLTLDCEVANEDNVVINKTYLWATDKSVLTDLVADTPRRNVDKTRRSAITGDVHVEVIIDEDGNVVSATAIDGKDPLKKEAALLARRLKFSPSFYYGEPLRATGNIKFNFVP